MRRRRAVEAGPVLAFAAALRALKDRSGHSYRTLATKALLSPAALHRYCLGKFVPPDFLIVLRFARAAAASRQEEAQLHQLWSSARSAFEGRLDPPAKPPQSPHETLVPAQLPIDVCGFVGRDSELRELTKLADGSDEPRLVVIAGMAGVGKTALAVRWAHSVADSFPDGQLYLNLLGFGPAGPPMDTNEAIFRLLSAFEVQADQIPTALDARATQFRSLLAGKRVLLVLDNARDAEQVRPLLPGSAGCVTVVTSRNQMPGLMAMQGAHPIVLPLLDDAEALRLLSHRMGAARLAAQREAASEIIAQCANLPLALSIVAAHSAIRPLVPLEQLAAQLRGTRSGLDAFADTDPAADLRTVFAWSYQALGPATARMFRLLWLHPGPEINTAAVASLAGIPQSVALASLFDLLRANLITEQTAGRFGLHDLLRTYATELAAAQSGQDECRAAHSRLLDHYLHTAHAAALLLQPYRDPITMPAIASAVSPELLANHAEARRWFLDEYPVLVTAIGLAFEAGLHTHSWQIAWTVANFFDRSGRWHDLEATQRTALASAQLLDDVQAQMHAHRLLGRAYTRLDQQDQARQHLNQALELARAAGDLTSQAHIHMTLGRIFWLQNRIPEGLQHALMTLELYRAAGHRNGQGYAMNNVGWFYGLLGEYAQGLVYGEQSLALFRELGDRHGQAGSLNSLGQIHCGLAHHEQAIQCYREALEIFREFDDRYPVADALTQLGEVYVAIDDRAAAADVWRQAIEILSELNHPDTEKTRVKLRELLGPS